MEKVEVDFESKKRKHEGNVVYNPMLTNMFEPWANDAFMETTSEAVVSFCDIQYGNNDHALHSKQ